MSLHVIIGAGPVGLATAALLADRGEQVRLLSRSGSGLGSLAVEAVAADATDTGRLAELTAGASVLYNCASPPYNRWPEEWPPLATAALTAAGQAGAVLVTMSNLYGYGPVSHPMAETDPLNAAGPKGRTRAAVWEQALAAHRAGRVRVTEARASDFFGPGVQTQSPIGERSVPRLLAGRPAIVLGGLDVPHSWTYVPDIAAALVILGGDERAWGRAWHVPTSPPMTQREIFAAIVRLSGALALRVRRIHGWQLRALGIFAPVLREFTEVGYQFDRPFVIDSSAFTSTFGARPTAVDEALSTTIRWWREQAATAAPAHR